MYADVVLGLDHHAFEDALEIAKEDRAISSIPNSKRTT
jgi:pyruvate,orthophosphate dikinase